MAQSTFTGIPGLGSVTSQIGAIGTNPLFHGSQPGSASYTVGASEYGQGEANTGSCGINTNSVLGFAELGPAPAVGKALGGLPCGTKLRITNPANGKTVIAEKVDVGSGGNPIGNLIRRVDLHYRTAQALGFNGTGPIEIEKLNAAGQGERINTSFDPKELLPFPFGPLVPGIPGLPNPLNLNPGELFEGHIPGLPGGVPELNPLQGLEKLVAGLKGFFKFFELISSPAGWLRLGKILLGVILLIIALAELAKIGSGSSATGIPTKAARLGTDAAVGAVI